MQVSDQVHSSTALASGNSSLYAPDRLAETAWPDTIIIIIII
jgi:hypothetical protein